MKLKISFNFELSEFLAFSFFKCHPIEKDSMIAEHLYNKKYASIKFTGTPLIITLSATFSALIWN